MQGGAIVQASKTSLPILGDENEYDVVFLMQDDDDIPYKNTKYIAFLENGSVFESVTDDQGYTNPIKTMNKEKVSIHLKINNYLDI